jgi:putative ABC transport system permease protein
MLEFFFGHKESVLIAVQSLALHKARSFLTMLGIIFGVGAVIAMLSIGEGARQESLEQIEVLGVRNIIVRTLEPDESGTGEEEKKTRPVGISTKDANAVREICPFAQNITVTWEAPIAARTYEGNVKTTLVGTEPAYASIFNVRMSEGSFLPPHHLQTTANVCIIGNEVKQALFGFANPINKLVKLQSQWFTVIGVMQAKKALKTDEKKGSSTNSMIIIPITSAMSQFPREMKITSRQMFSYGRRVRFGSSSQGQFIDRSTIDEIAVQVDKNTSISEASRIVSSIIQQRHGGQLDFSVTIPEQLIEQSQKTQSIFNIVMGAIAGISLLVGGIGIMNIMLASVLERTREIGVRRAMGATRLMVVIQFLSEAALLSLVGGVIGIFVGWGLTAIITAYAGWRTIISFWSIFIAFTVAVATGIIFGYYPAKRASEKDVIESLRYE